MLPGPRGKKKKKKKVNGGEKQQKGRQGIGTEIRASAQCPLSVRAHSRQTCRTLMRPGVLSAACSAEVRSKSIVLETLSTSGEQGGKITTSGADLAPLPNLASARDPKRQGDSRRPDQHASKQATRSLVSLS